MNLTIIKKRSRLGFTLVELIVVIAILAILAGIAIPVYSKYIKKANEAADLQLLDAVNTAFAAACLENNVGAKKLPDGAATITVDGDKCISGVEVDAAGITAAAIKATHTNNGFAMLGAHSVRLAATTSETINASFLKYFAGNTDKALKFFDSSDDFEFKDGAFHAVGTGGSGSTGGSGIDYSGLVIDDAAVTAFQNSTFSSIGVENLMNEVTTPVDALSSLIQNGSDVAVLGEEFASYAENILGKSIDEMTANEIANSIVFYMAHKSSGYTAEGVIADFNAGFFDDMEAIMAKNLSDDPEDQAEAKAGIAGILPDLALTYGVATAFLNTEAGANATYNGMNVKEFFEQKKDTLGSGGGMANFTTLMQMLGAVRNASGFNEYVAANGVQDVGGYLAAMSLIDSNVTAGSFDASALLSYGFDDSDLIDALKYILE